MDLVFFNYKYSFDIIRVELLGFHVEVHSKKEEKFEKDKSGNIKYDIGLGILSPD